ncbi:MAG TPA: CHAT domain-containing tetratricopeptide repeat protein [Thermoanaerobaculia bacterium]|nr:CHAT domain-containing tetratricopeptide repeat protein [Thermoanaerobaculia bacterium]
MLCGSTIARRTVLALGLALACGGPEKPPLRLTEPVLSPPGRSATAEQTIHVEPGAAEREIAGGQTHAYTFPLAKDRFADLVVDQRGIDVAVSLYGPGHRLLTTVDSPNEGQGPEPLPVVAEAGGDYRLEIRPIDPRAPAGRYALLVRAVRPADSRDRAYTAAHRTLAEGERLWQQPDAASQRQAVARFQEAISGFRALGERGTRAEALSILGGLHRNLGEPAAALAAYQEALSLFRELGRQSEAAEALKGIGIVRVTRGETEEALQSYGEALAIDRALRDRQAEASLLDAIARVYTLQGKMEKALATYERELSLQHALGPAGDKGETLISLGRAYALMGEPQRAIDYLNRGLPLLEARQRRLEAAGALDDIGKALVRTGRAQEGIARIVESRLAQRRLGNRPGEAVALHDLGATYESLGRKEEARRLYAEAVRELSEAGDRLRETMALLNLGRLQEEAGDLGGATAAYSRALHGSEASGDRSSQAAARLGLARVACRSGDLEGARQAVESALGIVEALRVEMVAPELRAAFLATRQEYYELYVSLLMRLHRREPSAGHDARAFEASELARARSLLDSLAQARTDLRRGIDPGLLRQEAELGDRVNGAERRRLSLAASGAPASRVEAAERELRGLLLQSERLRDRIRQASPRYAALGQARPASLRTIQRSLDPDTTLLEYALGRERSFLWAVTASSLTSIELPPRAVLEGEAREAVRLLGSSQHTLSRARTGMVLAGLSRRLLGPVAGQLRERLLIVGDGTLHILPFAALPIPGRAGSPVPLIAEHEILSLPSASALVMLRQETPAPSRSPVTVAVLADPVFQAADPRVAPGAPEAAANPRGEAGGGRFGRLPSSRLEAAEILTLIPPGRRLAALDFAASRRTVLSGRLEPYRIVHFATHGVLDSCYPELSGVMLSRVDERGHPQDGFLAAHDIYRLRLPADLVVLSACETARGQEVRGEGLIGLTRAFFSAGARRVLVSLWPVRDRATAELMRHFYREMLRNGRSPSAALRAAQDTLRQEPGWEEPHDWAGFILQGDWR